MYRIMIAVDGSDLALDAVRHGIALVRRGGLQATLMELATRGADMVAAASVEAAQDLMASAVALVDAAGVPYETEIGLGAVAATLVDMVERCGCDLLFIGARGLGGLRGAFLGSVSQSLVHISPVPVTVVKHAEPQELPDDDDDEDEDDEDDEPAAGE